MLKSRGLYAGVQIYTIMFDRDDDVLKTHAHAFPHVMLCCEGEVRVLAHHPETNEVLVTSDLVAGGELEVGKGVPHTVEPLIVPAIIKCVFPKRGADGNPIDASRPKDWTGDLGQFA